MDQKQFIRILRRYQKGIASPEEIRFIEAYYNLFETSPDGARQLPDDGIKEEMLAEVWANIQSSENKTKAKMRRLHSPMAKAAAAIAILLVSGVIFFSIFHSAKKPKIVASVQAGVAVDSIRPGGNKAVLTLAGGTQVVLDSAKDGSLASQGHTKIIKLNSGKLLYQQPPAGTATRQDPVAYNTLTTPRGGQYQVVLPDGSKVWLNAASSLRFPTSFTGDIRSVEVTGEAYFEIAPEPEKPFIVKVGPAHIQVLGTAFEVNAYEEEKTIRTTLSEGAVKMVPVWGTQKNEGVSLRPGQQGSMNRQTGQLQVKTVNVESVLAWKNGLFYFDNTNIKTIMREVSRWYNVDVVYETSELETKNFSGVLSRYSDVSALLERLELTGTVHFNVDGKTIVVTD